LKINATNITSIDTTGVQALSFLIREFRNLNAHVNYVPPSSLSVDKLLEE
jgi:hypothetical protein